MRYIIILFILCSCSVSNKSKSHITTDSTTVSVHKEVAVAKKKDSSHSGKSMITRNKNVKKEVKETAPVITWVKVDSSATVEDKTPHVTIKVKGGKLIGIKGTKVKETKEDKADSSRAVAINETRVTDHADTASKSDSSVSALHKEITEKNKRSRSFNWWWLLLIAAAGGCYWLFFTDSGKRWRTNAIGWVISKFV